MDARHGLDIEEALAAAGAWGRYQKLILLLSFVSGIPNAFVTLHFVFSQYEPTHHCTFPREYLAYVNQSNVESSEIIASIIPLELNQRNKWVSSQCKMYDRNYSLYPVESWPEQFKNENNSKIVDCMNGTTYAFTKSEETAVMEFSLICQNDWKAPVAVSFFQAGMVIGSFSGVTADWYGRRPVFILASAAQILSQVLTAVAWNFPVYCAAISLSGLSSLVNFVIGFVLMTEVTDHKWRNFMSISSTYSFAVGYCIIALMAYFFRQWRFFIGSMAVVGTIMYIPCCWFFPESPRWLAQKGRSDDAIKYLRLIARVNGKTKSLNEALLSKGNHIFSKNGITSSSVIETIRVLFRSGIASRFFATIYGWFVTSMMYYAISIYSSDFSSDRFVNLVLAGTADIPGCVVGFLLLKFIGRPRTALLLMSLCGSSSVILPFIPKDFPLVSTMVAIIGKASVSAVFYGWYLISSEVVPTLQRSAALSICSATARVGSFGVPYLMYTRKYHYFIPNLTMGAVAFTCGLVAIFLVPETLGIEIPDTAQEAKRNKRFYRFHIFKNFTVHKPRERTRKCVADSKDTVSMI